MGTAESKAAPPAQHQPQAGVYEQQGFLKRNKRRLHAAAKAGDCALLDQMLQPFVAAVTVEMSLPAYPGPAAAALSQAINQEDRRGRTPLLVACSVGSWECAHLLLEAGANILAADSEGNGCLHLASIHGHGHVVEQLLEKADVLGIAGRLINTLNLGGYSPLHYAAWEGHIHIVRKLLMASSSTMLPFHGTWDEYDRWLVVPVGATALHVAALQQHAGVVLALLQHYALQLRDWFPGDSRNPRPVDPRTWQDRQGAIPLHLALWRGLAPDSQLAALLNPRVNISTLFTPEQLDEMRRRGPPTLQVIASAALKANLMQQLNNVEQQLVLQQQLEAEAAAAKEREQQQRQQQQKQKQREQIWRRWWGRSTIRPSVGENSAAAPCHSSSNNSWFPGSATISHSATGAGSAAGANTAMATDRGSRLLGGGGSSSKPRDRGQVVSVEEDGLGPDQVLQGLRRTPSITLGAVQQYSSTTAGADGISHKAPPAAAGNRTQQQQQHGVSPAAGVYSEIEPVADTAILPGSLADMSGAATAEVASASVSTSATPVAGSAAQQHAVHSTTEQQIRGRSNAALLDDAHGGSKALHVPETASGQDDQGSNALESASSITLGVLDRIWAATSEQQQQQQVATADDNVTAGGAAGSTGGSTASQPATPEIVGTSNATRPQHSPSHSIAGSHHSSTGQELEHTVSVGHASPFADINEQIHKGTGSFITSFQLSSLQHLPVLQPASAAATAAEAGWASAAHPSSAPGVAAGKSAKPLKLNVAPVAKPLVSTSVSLGQLAARQRLQQHLQQQNPSANSSNSSSSNANTQEWDNASSHSSRSNARTGFQTEHGDEQQQHQQQVHPLLATAGIKSKDFEKLFTPLAWKLFQQQHDAGQLQQLQQHHHHAAGSALMQVPPLVPGQHAGHLSCSGASNQASSASFRSVTQQAPVQQEQKQQCVQSCHRRSFELPSSPYQGLFGAQRQHVNRMLLEAGRADVRALRQQSSVLGPTPSLNRAGSSLAVATSLAGALPGCVSEKLTQYLQVCSSPTGGLPAVPSNGVGSSGHSSGGYSSSGGSGDGRGVFAAVDNSSMDASVSGVSGAISSRRLNRLSVEGEVGNKASPCAEVCAVCMDKESVVGFASCQHSLCFTCAGCIVGVGLGVRPPVCPFCRASVKGFRLAAMPTDLAL